MKPKYIVAAKVAVWVACLLPVADVLWRAWNMRQGKEPDLTANPIEYITLATGWWALFILVSTLAITPLRKLTKQAWLIRFRRLLGLFAFFYATLHLITYVWLDKFWEWRDMLRDIQKRPFITAGMVAFLAMLPLAVTSTSWAIRKMGGKNWNLLHRLIYLSAIAGVVHYFWKLKAGYEKPIAFAVVLAVLLGWRVVAAMRERAA